MMGTPKQMMEAPKQELLETAVPNGYNKDNEEESLTKEIPLNYSEIGYIQHCRLTSGDINIAGPYNAALSLPQLPVIMPYSPLGTGEQKNEIEEEEIPLFSLNAKLHNGTLRNLPPGAADFLTQHNVHLNNVETFISFQSRPWKNDNLEFRPHPWLHQDAPQTSSTYAKTSNLSVSFADLNSQFGPFCDIQVTTHHNGKGSTVFSPDNMIVCGLSNCNSTEAFYSLCLDKETKRVAITFHCLLNNKDQEVLQQQIITMASGLNKRQQLTLKDFQANIVGVLPEHVTNGLAEFLYSRNQKTVSNPSSTYCIQEAAPTLEGQRHAETLEIQQLQIWLQQNPGQSAFRSGVEEVYARKLSEAGWTFAIDKELPTLNEWLTQNPGQSAFRSSVEKVYTRKLSEAGWSFAMDKEPSTLKTWLAQNPGSSEFRSSVEKVLRQKLSESKTDTDEATTNLNPPAASGKLSNIHNYKRTLDAVKDGYRTLDGATYTVSQGDILQMQSGTAIFDEQLVNKITINQKYSKTTVRTSDEECLVCAKNLVEQGLNPVILNFAYKDSPGGGIKDGCMAQEESLFLASNYHLGLDPAYNTKLSKPYQIPEFGAIYTPNVTVIRDSYFLGSNFRAPWKANMIASAAYDWRIGGPCKDMSEEEYRQGMEKKIRAILKIAASQGHDCVVLGAFGCGAFRKDDNTPNIVASLFKKILNEEEYKGAFKIVSFPVLHQNTNNFNVFNENLNFETINSNNQEPKNEGALKPRKSSLKKS